MKNKRQITAQLNKSEGGQFLGANDFSLMKLNLPYSSTVTSRYYKGLSAHGDNLVVEIEEETDTKQVLCSFDKEIGRGIESEHLEIKGNISPTITARYYKGIESKGCPCVLEWS